MSYPEYVSATERGVIDPILNRALASGYSVSVNDGEEFVLRRSKDLEAIQTEIGHTCETYLHFYAEDTRLGWIWLVHGNDEDVVVDHVDNSFMNELASY